MGNLLKGIVFAQEFGTRENIIAIKHLITLEMRTSKSIVLLIVSVLLFMISGCSKEEVKNPYAQYTLTIRNENGITVLTEPYIVDVGQKIDFTNVGSAQYHSFFSGMAGRVWTDYLNPDDTTTEGTDTNEFGDFSITYTAPGDYIATVVLINRKAKDPSNFKQVILNFAIKVVVPAQ